MKAYILTTNKSIEPFREHTRDCLIGNQKLSDIHKEVLHSIGLTPIFISKDKQIEDSEEYISFDDTLFFTKKILLEFIIKSRRLNKATVCAIKPPTPGPYFYGMLATQDVKVYSDRVEYPLIYRPSLDSRVEPTPLLIDVDQHQVAAPLPEHMFGFDEYRIPVTDKVIVQINHWTNLHYANLAMSANEPASLLNSKTKLLSAILKSRSFNQWKVGHHANRIGKNCDIHPRAWVEFSTLGDNVKIGAGSVVNCSVVGSGTMIGNNATTEFSVVGDRCWIGSGSMVRYSLLYPGVLTVARLINYSVCGRNTFLGDGVTLCDFRLDGKSIPVIENDSTINTESPLLGTCLGHGVYLGAGCIVGPGRVIPNGIRLSPDKSRIITKVDSSGFLLGYRRISEYNSYHSIPTTTGERTRKPLLRRILKLPSVK
jgi:NDP-sugar pyrophosphorylase family protein